MRRPAGLLLLACLTACAPPPPAPPAAPAEAAAPKPRREPPLRVVELLKADAAAVEAALGKPVLRRDESGGEVWLYAHASGCAIDLMLFPDRGTLRVSHATTRTPREMSEAACLRLVADQ
jgi:hypothetical protein